MVFGWVSTKFKERQLQKALIQNNAEDMVIVNGMSILHPNYRLFYNYPFYDKETDTLDLKEIDSFFITMKYNNYSYHSDQCKKCYTKKHWDEYHKKLQEVVSDKYITERINYSERKELENLRGLFAILTGEDKYYYPSDIRNFIKIVEDYREQYRNLDETICNFENKIYQKNKEIERLHSLLDTKTSRKPVKPIPKDNRPIKRNDKIYQKFRIRVLKRDKVCQCCGATDSLHVHHLSSFVLHNSRGADTDNGIALCEDCHKEYHRIYGKLEDNNPVNFAKFMREYGQVMQSNLDCPIQNEAKLVVGGK